MPRRFRSLRPRAFPRRGAQRALVRRRRRLRLCARLSFLLALHRRPRARTRRRSRHARDTPRATAATTCRRQNGSPSAITSPRSPDPGPLVGPVLAAQFGYLPSTLWIIIGAVLGGCVQDFVILGYSLKRDGRSLGRMASEEIGPVAGFTALVGVLMIMVILDRRARPGRRQRDEAQRLGDLDRRRDGADRDARRHLHDASPPRPPRRGLGARRRPDHARSIRRPLRRRLAASGITSSWTRRSCPSGSSATAFSPRCCRSGCCSRRATTCPPSSRLEPSSRSRSASSRCIRPR